MNKIMLISMSAILLFTFGCENQANQDQEVKSVSFLMPGQIIKSAWVKTGYSAPAGDTKVRDCESLWLYRENDDYCECISEADTVTQQLEGMIWTYEAL